MDQLYLIEVLVDKITFGENISEVPKREEIIIEVKLGNVANLEVQTDALKEILYPSEIDMYRRDVRINSGKSYLFSKKADDLRNTLQESPLAVTVRTVKRDSTEDPIVGDVTISWTPEFIEMVYSSRINANGLNPVSIKDVYKITKYGEVTGEIELFLRLSCFGLGVETQFQVIQREKSGEPPLKKYLFKSSNTETTFQAQKYGELGTASEVLPVAPIYNPSDPKTWRATKGLSPDQMTTDKIKQLLCKNPDCPGAQRFKEFGIGPAATGVGLGTVYGPTEVPLSYGLSHTYGNLENYGPYGVYSRPKSLDQPFVPKDNNNVSTCNNCNGVRTTNLTSNVAGTLYCKCGYPLRLTGGAPIEDDDNIGKPMEMCKDLMDSFDKVLSAYKQAMGPCGEVICPYAPNLVAEECKKCCKVEPKKEPNNKNQLPSACGAPTCPYGKIKLGVATDEDFYEAQLMYGPNAASSCGSPKCPFPMQPELPPIHWDCPEPLPKGACRNPKCPFKPKELQYNLVPKGPCGSSKCPYAVPAFCGDSECPFGPPRSCPYDNLPPPSSSCSPQCGAPSCNEPRCPPPSCASPGCPGSPPPCRTACQNPGCPSNPPNCGDPTCPLNPQPLPCPAMMPPCKPPPCGGPQCPYAPPCPPQPLCTNPKCPFAPPCPPPPCSNPRCPYASPCPPLAPCGDRNCPFTPPCPQLPPPCSNPRCPYATPCPPAPPCGDPSCPFASPPPCPPPPCPPPSCDNPSCPSAAQAETGSMCDSPYCPYAKQPQEDSNSMCDSPDCPFKQTKDNTSMCSGPDCPYKEQKPLDAGSGSFCSSPDCPFAPPPCEAPSAAGGDECPTICKSGRSMKPCTLKVGDTKVTVEYGMDRGDTQENKRVSADGCAANAKPAQSLKGGRRTDRGSIVVGDIEYTAGDRMEVESPCSPLTCRHGGGSLACMECGKSVGGGQKSCIPETCHGKGGNVICDMCSAGKGGKGTSQSAPTIGEKLKKKSATGSQSEKVIPKNKGARKGKKQKSKYVYNLGDLYPGVNVGHKECVIPGRNVPAKMGWLWNIYTPCLGLKPRVGWRPGAVGRTIAKRIYAYRKAKGQKLLEPLTPKSSKKKIKSKYSVYESDSGATVAPKPTLQIKKREGCYYITMNPLKDPKTIEENENPYMDCTPMQFKITKNKEKIQPNESDSRSCVCGIEEEDEKKSCTSSDSELDIEFTPPAGIIRPERLKKKKNVVHIDTQYSPEDFQPKGKDKKEKKGKDKKKGGKGKKGKKGKKK